MNSGAVLCGGRAQRKRDVGVDRAPEGGFDLISLLNTSGLPYKEDAPHAVKKGRGPTLLHASLGCSGVCGGYYETARSPGIAHRPWELFLGETVGGQSWNSRVGTVVGVSVGVGVDEQGMLGDPLPGHAVPQHRCSQSNSKQMPTIGI